MSACGAKAHNGPLKITPGKATHTLECQACGFFWTTPVCIEITALPEGPPLGLNL